MVASCRGQKRVTIIGGGLAGLALGIRLRQREVPVTICEAGRYPRHRVCGEFFSGRGLSLLSELGLRESLDQASPIMAQTAQFFVADRALARRKLPVPAMCLSRHVLDAMLADLFQQLGGELRCETRCQPIMLGEGVIRATGRRVRTESSHGCWYGLKAHARNVELQADLEMHLGADCYVGLCRLPGGEVNVSGLFRKNTSEQPHLRSLVERIQQGSSVGLSDRLRRAEWNESSYCSVGGLPFRSRLECRAGEICIGDAMGMIPPVTGNGMSLALESARVAVGPVADFAEGRLSWNAASQAVARACRAEFARRLRFAGWLHSFLFHPMARRWIVPPLMSSEIMWRMLFRSTR